MGNHGIRITDILATPVGRVWSLTLVMVAIALLLAGCHDTPVKPKPTMEVLYFSVTHPSVSPPEHRIYTFDVTDFSLLDSLIITGPVVGMEASADGDWLYVQTVGDALRKTQSSTGTVAWTRPGISVPRLLSDGKILVGAGIQGQFPSVVIDQATGETVRLLPDSLTLGFGPGAGTEVAAIVRDESTLLPGDSVVTALDCATGSTRGRFVPYVGGHPLNVYYARLAPDGVRTLTIGPRLNVKDSWFVVGNLQTGETLYSHQLIYPYGEVQVSDDGSVAAVTDPSAPLIYDSRPTLDLFSLNSYTHLRRFDYAIDSITSDIGQVRFLDDERHLIVAPGNPLGVGPLYRIDLQTMTVVNSALEPGCDSAAVNCPFTGGIALGRRACANDGQP